jgi:hypothetical protein
LPERGTVAVADPLWGRFRSFLLADLTRFLIDRHRDATLAALAGNAKPGVPATKSQREPNVAMAQLSRTANMGYRPAGTYRTEDTLDPLRDHADFRPPMLDLVFPDQPFGTGR